MAAACAGRSRAKVSKKVGCEFMHATANAGSLPEKVRQIVRRKKGRK